MKPENKNKGFTLIELLVVIAIIGLLSAVVLASLNTARKKGVDAAIQSDMNAIQTQAVIYYDTNNTYGGGGSSMWGCGNNMFSTDNTIKTAITNIDNLNGGGFYLLCSTNGPRTQYSVVARFTSNTNNWWCIDSTGVAREESGTTGAFFFSYLNHRCQ